MVARPSQEEFKVLVRTRTDFLRRMSDSIKLTRAGRNFRGWCPLHDSQRPRLVMNSARQTCLCRVSGERGDRFAYLMKQNSVDFATAHKRPAQWAGIMTLPLELGNFE